MKVFIDSSGVPRGYYEYGDIFLSERPSFPGDFNKLLEFINANRIYPPEAYRRGAHGRVTCWFIVNANGTVSDVNILRSVDPQLDEEAIRILNLMPRWEPGRDRDGVPVPVRVTYSITFRR